MHACVCVIHADVCVCVYVCVSPPTLTHKNLCFNSLQEFLEEWTGGTTKKSNFLRDSLEIDVHAAKKSGRKGYRTYDGCAMATVIDPSIVTEEEKSYATVELSGQLTRGQMVVDWSGMLRKDQNVSLIMGLDMTKTQQLFRSMIF